MPDCIDQCPERLRQIGREGPGKSAPYLAGFADLITDSYPIARPDVKGVTKPERRAAQQR
jgi:hypothetical protein